MKFSIPYFILNIPMLPCPIKQGLGFDCPGCGMQRSFWYLTEGNLKESIITYPALIPSLIMIVYLILHLKFRFKNGHKILLTLFSVNTIIIVINYILKFI